MSQERDQTVHGSARFYWEGGFIFRRWLDGTKRVVLRSNQHLQLICQVHEELGHFGVHCTYFMLRGLYWWMGMQ